jgi:alkyl sulfatase BDS1-like metallo-beta-lactamase superfamily hydrolase
MFFDYLGVRLNGPKADGKKATINMVFTDSRQKYVLALDNSVLNYFPDKQDKNADCTVTLKRAALDDVVLGQTTMPKAILAGDIRVTGNAKALQEMLGSLDTFDFWFNIVTVNAPPKK